MGHRVLTLSLVVLGITGTASFSSGGVLRVPQTSPISPVAPAAPLLPQIAAADLAAGFVRWGVTHLGEDAMLAMAAPHAYWLLRDWRRRAFGDLEGMRGELQAARKRLVVAGTYEDVLRGAELTVRPKGLFSTFEKAVVRQKHVHDVLAVRVVLRKGLGSEACFAAHDVIRQIWPTANGRHKDYVSVPKRNGYQAVHDTMLLESAHPFEVQIRTTDMHKKAEYGTASHRRYKGSFGHLPMAVMAATALALRGSPSKRPLWLPAEAVESFELGEFGA